MCLPQRMLGYHPPGSTQPPRSTPPGKHTPSSPGSTPPRADTPQKHTHPAKHTLPVDSCCCGRYVSYWNAFLSIYNYRMSVSCMASLTRTVAPFSQTLWWTKYVRPIFTARKHSLGQDYMFTGMCLSTEGYLLPRGLIVPGVHGPGGVCSRVCMVPGVSTPKGGAWSREVSGGDSIGWLLLRAVRILLECILVSFGIDIMFNWRTRWRWRLRVNRRWRLRVNRP